MEHELVVKSNKLIEAGFKLSLNEQRVILMAITHVRRDRALSSDEVFEIKATDFMTLFGMNQNKAYEELQNAAQRLFERFVIIDNPDPDNPELVMTKTRWISSIDYIPNHGKIRLMFAQKMIPYLSVLEREFTKYKLESIAKMTSTHAIRLYELLMQWGSVGERDVSIEWLKRQTQIEGKYTAIKDFKKSVIDVAVSQINEYTDLEVSYDQRKSGRTVTHLIFTFKPKLSPKLEEKATKKVKPEGLLINGVPKVDIERLARPGESYEDAAERIKKSCLAWMLMAASYPSLLVSKLRYWI